MISRFGHGPRLLERFWAALRRDRAATPPAGLNPAIADLTIRLERELRPRALEPSTSFEARLERQLLQEAGTQPGERAWTGPAISPNAHRRVALSPQADDTTEQTIMSSTTDTVHELVPIQQRRWAREALKLAAAAVIFVTIGAVLALTLRDDDDTPAVVSPGPTPTPVVAPSPTATVAPASSPTVMAQAASPTAAQTATPTEAPAPSPAATEVAPTPIVMGPPATDLPAAGQITATIPVGASPLAVAAGHGSIWVQNDRDGTVSRIDPATNAVVATIQVAKPLGPEIHTDSILVIRQSFPDLAVDATSVWAIKPEEQAVVKIDPATNAVVATVPLEANAISIAADGSSLWVSLFGTSSVVRIDTATGEIVATIEDVPSPAGIAVSEDAVWVANHMSDTVTRIDPETNEIVAQISVRWQGAPNMGWECGLCATEVLADEHGVWVTLWIANHVARIDPATNQLMAAIPVGLEARSLASDARGLWVGHLSSTGVLLIDPASNQVIAAVPAAESPTQFPWITFWEDTLWAARSSANDVVRIDLQPQ